MRVLVIGRTESLYNTALKVLESSHNLVGIITSKAEPEYGKDENDFKRLADDRGIPFLLAENLNSKETESWIKDKRADVAISINWKTRVKQATFDLFKHGVLNAHGGDLPKFRGNAAMSWAVASGEKDFVLTIHQMDEELDSGDIYLKKSMPIKDSTYINDLYTFVKEQSPQMFLEVLDGLESGDITPQKQPDDPSLSLRCYPRTSADGELDWTKDVVELHRIVRAAAEPYAGAFTYLKRDKLIIWRARVEIPEFNFLGTPGQVAEIRKESGEVVIVGKGGFLVLQEIQSEDGERMKASDYIKSIRTRLGMTIEDLRQISKSRQ